MKFKLFAVFIVGSCFGAGCAKSGFQGATSAPPKSSKSATGEGASGSGGSGTSAQGGRDGADGSQSGSSGDNFSLQELGCEDELRTIPARLAISKSAGEQVVSLTHMCKLQVETLSTSTSKHPTDIVFAIDITASMDPNINAIKNSVVRFAEALESRAWDARFAAVGFRDSIGPTINFTNADSLSNTLNSRSWGASSGGNEQEYSQGGIAKAIDMLISDTSSNPDRAKADKIVLMVTDNPGYDYVSRV
ncbi:MAG: von Willebrand factor type domain, partial [Pseudomonadota bacterium]